MRKKFSQLEDAVKVLLWHLPWDEAEKHRELLLHPEKGPYFYFRRSKSPLHERLTQLVNHSKVPNVLIHGSPHIDNYAKTQFGAGMIDFDRAYRGPYLWDMVCLLIAIHLRNPDSHYCDISKNIAQTLQESYLASFNQPETPYQLYTPLENVILKPWEENMKGYAKSEKKWASQKNTFPVDVQDPFANALLQDLLSHHPQATAISSHHVSKIFYASGSFGRRRYIYLLEKNRAQPIFMDIKETKNFLASTWTYTKWYKNPYPSEGRRLFEAAKIYAPDFYQHESYASLKGIDYWGREIPSLNRKPNKIFTTEEQLAFAIAGGSQLGRGHRLSLYDISENHFINYFNQNYSNVIAVTNVLLQELMAVWEEYQRIYGKMSS